MQIIKQLPKTHIISIIFDLIVHQSFQKMHSNSTYKLQRQSIIVATFLLLAILTPQFSASQNCVFETAADLYKADVDAPQKIYRPSITGSDIQYFESGSIDASAVKIKTKKALLIHDEFKGNFLLLHNDQPRCSEGSLLLSRPENEEIITLTKQGELIKGFGTIFPYSENLKIYKDEHRSGEYYNSVSSTTEVVLLIYFIDESPDTKFFVSGKELAKYSSQLHDLLVPAPAIAASSIEISALTNDVQAQEVNEEVATITTNEIQAELAAEAVVVEQPIVTTPANQIEITPVNETPESEPVETTPVSESSASVSDESKPMEVSSDSNPIITPVQDVTPVQETAVPVEEAPRVIKPKSRPVLNDLEKDELMVKAKEKVETLGGCFEILASTSAPNAFKDDNYKLAISLFIHDSVEVAVSSLTRNAFKHYRITTYLKRMRTFNYTDVEISFHNVSKVSNLRLNPDGTYTGIITFSQVFKGFIEGKPVYADRTDKNIEIIIRAREVFAGSLEASVEWDVFLGNIGVDQTSAF